MMTGGLRLVADDVRRAGALGGLFDAEVEFRSFREVLAADIFHVEEHVVVRILGGDETVTARVVEEVNRTVCHYKQTYYPTGDNPCEGHGTVTYPYQMKEDEKNLEGGTYRYYSNDSSSRLKRTVSFPGLRCPAASRIASKSIEIFSRFLVAEIAVHRWVI